jgi:hypothetical protein
MKERLAVTDLRRQKHKMEMRLEVSDYGDSAMGMETNSAVSKSTGKLRAAAQGHSKLPKYSKPVGQSTSSEDASSGMVSSWRLRPFRE